MGDDKILVIDDEPMIRHLITRILERAGYAVMCASNGAQGLIRFRRDQPALVITDLIMPEREGIETIRHMLRERPGTPIIAISGGTRTASVDFLAMARELGASAILRKPFEPCDLLSEVARYLDSAPLVDHA